MQYNDPVKLDRCLSDGNKNRVLSFTLHSQEPCKKREQSSKQDDSLVEAVEVIAQDVTQPTEFCRALVDQAKLEGLGSCHGIQALQLHIAPQHIQNGAIGLPQEFEPRRHQLSVCPVLQHPIP